LSNHKNCLVSSLLSLTPTGREGKQPTHRKVGHVAELPAPLSMPLFVSHRRSFLLSPSTTPVRRLGGPRQLRQLRTRHGHPALVSGVRYTVTRPALSALGYPPPSMHTHAPPLPFTSSLSTSITEDQNEGPRSVHGPYSELF
jgi:hypothetical protein